MSDKQPQFKAWEDIVVLKREPGKREMQTERLHQKVLDIVKEKFGFTQVTKVQNAVIPLFLSNKDVCVKACTGSGKTLAFVVPLISKLYKMSTEPDFDEVQKNQVLGLLMAPSRELAIQIFQVLKEFESIFKKENGENSLNMCYFIGGDKAEYDIQRIESKGANIIVATPGRTYDLIEKNALNFKRLEIFVMDEADKLLDQGNEIKMNSIMSNLPRQRRTGLFSATMPTQLKNLVKTGMRNPHVVEVKTEDQGIFAVQNEKLNNVNIQTIDSIEQTKDEIDDKMKQISEIPMNLENFYQNFDNQSQKLPGLFNFLKNDIKKSRIIIFFATCASVNFHFPVLQLLFPESEIAKLHGKIDQKKRSKIYKSFRESVLTENHQILLTTDLSARGIDIPDVDWIIQYDPPQWSDSFVHRIGRTARAGRKGQSILFLNEPENAYINFLQGKKVEIKEFESKHETSFKDLQNQIQEEMQKDRDLVNKSQDAFVSFIRYYKEHQLNFIFSFNLLCIGNAANSFCLFKIPRVKEILGKQLKGFEQNNTVIIDDIPYRDKNKGDQKQEITQKRKEKLQQKMEEREAENEMVRALKDKTKAENAKKKLNLTRTEKKTKKREADWQEWEDLQKEENLNKKLKRGKITQAQYDEQMGEDTL